MPARETRSTKSLGNVNRWIVRLGLVLLIAAASTSVAFASDFAFPETPVGEVARLYFEAMNDDGTDRMREFIVTHRTESALARTPLEARLARLPQMRGILGRVDPRVVLEENEHSLTIAAYSPKAETWFSFGFELEATPPHKLELIRIQPTADPSKKEIDFGKATSLEELVRTAVENSDVPAMAAAFVTKDGVIESAAYGVRVSGESSKVGIGDPFHIGSVTKSMTATIIGKLLEDGRLSLDDTLVDLLPGFTMNEAYKAVTLRELLGHRAGFSSYTTDEEVSVFKAPSGTPREQRMAFAEFVLGQEPSVEPGTAYQYSNAGYSVVGHVAEIASGESWEDLLRQVIFDPLEMSAPGFGWPATKKNPNRPRGHYIEKSGVRAQPLDDQYVLEPFLAPAGDVHCSASDLARFALLHLRGLLGTDDVLRSETIRSLHAPDQSWDKGQTYAAGWLIEESENGSPVHRHSGSAGTFFCLIEVDPEAGVASVVLMNSGDMANDHLGRLIIEEYKTRLARN